MGSKIICRQLDYDDELKEHLLDDNKLRPGETLHPGKPLNGSSFNDKSIA